MKKTKKEFLSSILISPVVLFCFEKVKGITKASTQVIKHLWVWWYPWQQHSTEHGRLSYLEGSHKGPECQWLQLLTQLCMVKVYVQCYCVQKLLFRAPGPMVTDMLAPAQHFALSIISACFYIMIFGGADVSFEIMKQFENGSLKVRKRIKEEESNNNTTVPWHKK